MITVDLVFFLSKTFSIISFKITTQPLHIVRLFSQFNDAVIDHEEIKEFVAEPWFILLLAGVITLMVILLAAVLFVRYRQLGAKKSHLGGNYVFGIFQCAVHAIRFSEN